MVAASGPGAGRGHGGQAGGQGADRVGEACVSAVVLLLLFLIFLFYFILHVFLRSCQARLLKPDSLCAMLSAHFSRDVHHKGNAKAAFMARLAGIMSIDFLPQDHNMYAYVQRLRTVTILFIIRLMRPA